MTPDIDALAAEYHRLCDADFTLCRGGCRRVLDGTGYCADCYLARGGSTMAHIVGSEIEPQCVHGVSFHRTCALCYRTVSGPPCPVCQGRGWITRYSSGSVGFGPQGEEIGITSAWNEACPAGCAYQPMYYAGWTPVLAKGGGNGTLP